MVALKTYGALDLRGHRIRNIGAPLASTDAASRAWVEGRIEVVDTRITELEFAVAPPENDPGLHVGPTNQLSGPGVWIQTGLGADGTDFTFWIEDGS